MSFHIEFFFELSNVNTETVIKSSRQIVCCQKFRKLRIIGILTIMDDNDDLELLVSLFSPGKRCYKIVMDNNETNKEFLAGNRIFCFGVSSLDLLILQIPIKAKHYLNKSRRWEFSRCKMIFLQQIRFFQNSSFPLKLSSFRNMIILT